MARRRSSGVASGIGYSGGRGNGRDRGSAFLLDRLAQGGLADGAAPLGLLAGAGLARLLVILVGAQLALQAAALDQLLEPPQGRTDRLPVVNPHPQSHIASRKVNNSVRV